MGLMMICSFAWRINFVGRGGRKKKIVDNIENKNSLRVYDEFLQLSWKPVSSIYL